MTLAQLPLDNLEHRHWGLLPSTATSYLDAARVCLDRHHVPPTDFRIADDGQISQVILNWLAVDERTQNAWANLEDATRDGAYAIALAAVEFSRDWVAVRRAETRTGADYYVMPIGADLDDLERCYRLEISGTHLGEIEVRKRLRQKIAQTLKGNSPLPAIAAVVGFKEKLVIIQTVEEPL
jgi:hypothetical protein